MNIIMTWTPDPYIFKIFAQIIIYSLCWVYFILFVGWWRVIGVGGRGGGGGGEGPRPALGAGHSDGHKLTSAHRRNDVREAQVAECKATRCSTGEGMRERPLPPSR